MHILVNSPRSVSQVADAFVDCRAKAWTKERDMKKLLALALVAAAAGTASADILDINLAGWNTFSGFNSPANTSTNVSLPAGTQITQIEWIGLAYESINGSYLSELVLSVNDSLTGPFWDSRVSAVNAPGVFGPGSGAFANPGLFGSGPFTMTTNNLFITVYESFDDGGITVQDAAISAGTLRITYTPIPTPGAAALLGMGGLLAARRRR